MTSGIKRVGVLTGGGDAPGLNPAIKGLVYRGSELGLSIIGLFDGWRGLLDPLVDFLPLDRDTVQRWDRDGGTNLGSSRTNPFRISSEANSVDRSDEVIKNIAKLKLDAVVVCGGEDTLGVAAQLAQTGVCVVGIPKTIDKDLAGTDYTLGFDTALRNITEVIERSRTPAGSHRWVQVIEVMGRHAGHLALWSGVAGQAHLILLPEHPFCYEKVFRLLRERLGEPPDLARDRFHRSRYSVIVVSEGAYAQDGETVTIDERHDAFGHARLGGIGEVLARRIMNQTPYEARAVALGHPQRGGAPSPLDRVMGLMFGARAAEAVANGDFGKMVSSRGVAPACDLSLIDLSVVRGKINTVEVERFYDTERYHMKNLGMNL